MKSFFVRVLVILGLSLAVFLGAATKEGGRCWNAEVRAEIPPPSLPATRPAQAATSKPAEAADDDRFSMAEILFLMAPDKPRGTTSEGVPFYAQLPPAMLQRFFRLQKRNERVLILQGGEASIYVLRPHDGFHRAFLDIQRRSPQGKVELVQRQGVLDLQGRVVVPFRYLSLGTYSDTTGFGPDRKGAALVQCLDRTWGAIRVDETPTIPCVYPQTTGMPHKDRLRFHAKDGKIGMLFLSTGKAFLPFEYDTIVADPKETYIYVKRQGRWGVFNDEGKLVIPLLYEALGYTSYVFCLGGWITHLEFHHGAIPAKKDGKWGVLREGGQVLYPFVYTAIYYPQKDGRVYYLKGKEEGFLQLKAPTP